MFYSQIDPVLARLGQFEVRYYGLVYALSFILLYFFLVYLAKQRKISITKERASDIVVYAIIGLVAGARIFYIIPYILIYYIFIGMLVVASAFDFIFGI